MSYLLPLSPAEFCISPNFHDETIEFASQYATMAEVWDNCPNAHWLLWILDELETIYDHEVDESAMLRFAEWCRKRVRCSGNEVDDDVWSGSHASLVADLAGWSAEVLAEQADREIQLYERHGPVALSSSSAGVARAAADAALQTAAEGGGVNAVCAAMAAAAVATQREQADKLRRMIPNPFRP